MPKIAYLTRRFSPGTMGVLKQANAIIDEWVAQGYRLTLRQLYYQFVSRDLIPNTTRSYKRLGDIINEGRLCGYVDWNAIEDRTRNLRQTPSWDTPEQIMEAAAASYREPLWDTQPLHVEVWIEKDALAGVFGRVCEDLRVPFFACRGYPSQSEVWEAGQRFLRIGKPVVILHFGDHDPSGIDMTRDLVDRLRRFTGGMVKITRKALNMDQVEEFNPPPNPAKQTDSRFEGYVRLYGDESWELDALPPTVLSELVRSEVELLRDADAWQEAVDSENAQRKLLSRVPERWTKIAKLLKRK